jgi:hypothetical protein
MMREDMRGRGEGALYESDCFAAETGGTNNANRLG